MAYHLVAVDFLPPTVIQASLVRLAAEFASGAQFLPYSNFEKIRLPTSVTSGLTWRQVALSSFD